jgi:hypothetical protein
MASMSMAKSGSEMGVIPRPAWPIIANPGSPGRLDPFNPAGAMLFDTSFGAIPADALDVFFSVELPNLDWLADYVMDETVKTYAQDNEPSFEVVEDEEIHFEKRALTTTESDSGWDT